MAARHGHTEIVKTLVENAADIHAIQNDKRAGYTPFHEAISAGHISNVRYLLLVDNNPKHWVEAHMSLELDTTIPGG
jgi:ankyrin repeat protein